MPGSWPQHELPRLTTLNCKITSQASRRYNCIAWVAGDTARWWWPDPFGIGYWPDGVPRAATVEAIIKAYQSLGYQLCYDASLQPNIQKIAIFGKEKQDGSVLPTHAALQLESGEWTSKLGPFEDVKHNNADDVNGPTYGKIICYMSRPRS